MAIKDFDVSSWQCLIFFTQMRPAYAILTSMIIITSKFYLMHTYVEIVCIECINILNLYILLYNIRIFFLCTQERMNNAESLNTQNDIKRSIGTHFSCLLYYIQHRKINDRCI